IAFPEILEQKREGGTIRAWVAGCSTGEEVYTLAIALLEFLGDRGVDDVPIQIFATDVRGAAIDKARTGLYPESSLRDLGEGQLNKYCKRLETGYQIKKAVRDLCAFVRHDLGSDPPFSRLDLVSC